MSPRYFERRLDLGVKQAFEWELRRLTLPDGQHGVVCYFADVTRRWVDQEALRISEERFRVALDISELGAWELNLTDHTAWRSPRHDQVFGYAQLLPAWTYEVAREHVLEDDRDDWDRHFQSAMADHKDWNFEVRIRRADGATRWIWAYGKHILNADGQAIRMFGLVADISDRKAAEAALQLEVLERQRAEQALQERVERSRLEEAARKQIRDLEERFRLLVDGVADYAIFMLDAQGSVASWNRGAERMKGYRAAEIIGQHFSTFYPEADRLAGGPRRALEIASQMGRYEEEGWRIRKDGSQFWAGVLITALRNEEGALVGFAKVSRDLSERRRREEHQQTLTQRLALALRVSGSGVWDWHVESNAIAWDDAMYRIYGIATGTVIDYAVWRDAVLADDLTLAEAGLQAAIAQKGSQSRSFRILHPTLGIRYIEADYGAVLDSDRNVVRVVGVNLDVTEREQAAEDLRQSNARLEHGLALLARQNEEISALGELGEILQSCADTEEIQTPIRTFMPALFHGSSGCFYLLRESNNKLDVVADWGIAVGSAPEFAATDCWAIRRGEVRWTDARDGLRSGHVNDAEHRGLAALCVPMIAQGNTLGVLFIQPSGAAAIPLDAQARRDFERMASMTADRVGIAIANIQLSTNLRQQSIRDPLTGLFNRRYLEKTLEREMSRTRREQSSLAVVMVDADHFKSVNDSYGHAVGDQVLRSIAKMLGHACRPSDAVCRFGGEEFVILMPATTLAQAAVKAQQLCHDARTFDYSRSGIAVKSVTISVGVAAFPQNGDTCDSILRAADQALYSAKKAGRDRVVSAG